MAEAVSRAARGAIHYVGWAVDSSTRHRPMGAVRAAAWKQARTREFPMAKRVLAVYRGAHQGSTPACSLVGFHNLARVCGYAMPETWQTQWGDRVAPAVDLEDMWRAFGPTFRDPPPVTYVRLRHTTYEHRFVVDRWDRAACDARYGRVVGYNYAAAPFVYEHGNLIEGLLDRGNAVLVNALGHSRTCVAYNATHLLFADNYAPDVHKSRGTQVFAAGFSVVDKWQVYSHARDLMFLRMRR